MRLKVRANGKDIEVDIENDANLLMLKRNLASQHKTGISQVRVLKEGRILIENKLLSEFGIKDQDTIAAYITPVRFYSLFTSETSRLENRKASGKR